MPKQFNCDQFGNIFASVSRSGLLEKQSIGLRHLPLQAGPSEPGNDVHRFPLAQLKCLALQRIRRDELNLRAVKLAGRRGITDHTGDVVTRCREFVRHLPADVAPNLS